jgi:PRTRC genetic system protein E
MDTVNFFGPLAELVTEGEVMLNVEIGKNGYMMVSVLYSHKQVKDSSLKRITPLIFKGFAKELDEKFFSTLAAPMKKTVGLAINMLEYERNLEEVIQANKANQKKQINKSGKAGHLKEAGSVMQEEDGVEEEALPVVEKTEEERLAEEKKKRFDKMMVEANAEAKTGNYTGAWMKLPTIKDFPEMEELIARKREEFSSKFAA